MDYDPGVFSARTRWDRTANRLATLTARKRAAGVRVLDLTETNPTRVGLQGPPGLLATLADPAALSYDPDPRGTEPARQAVSADYGRRGLRVDPGRIVLT